MSNHIRLSGVTLLLVSVFAPPALAYPITFEFGGEITGMSGDTQLLDGLLAPGDSWSMTFTIDSETPDEFPNDPDEGDYRDPNGQVIFCAGTLDWDPLGVGSRMRVLAREYPGYHYLSFSMAPSHPQLGVLRLLESGVSATDEQGEALESTDLLREPISLALFEDLKLRIELENDSHTRVGVIGTVTTFTPEPSSGLLVAAAMIAFGSGRRRCGQGGELRRPHAPRYFSLLFAISNPTQDSASS